MYCIRRKILLRKDDLDFAQTETTQSDLGSSLGGDLAGASSISIAVLPPAALKLLTKILRGDPSLDANGVGLKAM